LVKNGYQISADINRDLLARLVLKEILEAPRGKGGVFMDLGRLSPDVAKSIPMLLPPQWFKGKNNSLFHPLLIFAWGELL